MSRRGGQAQHKTSPQGESISDFVHSSDLPGLIWESRRSDEIPRASRSLTRRPENVSGPGPRATLLSNAGDEEVCIILGTGKLPPGPIGPTTDRRLEPRRDRSRTRRVGSRLLIGHASWRENDGTVMS